MAENDQDRSTEDLSDEASPYRLEEFRRKGQVGQSRELAAVALLLASGMAISVMAPQIANQLAAYMRETFTVSMAEKTGAATAGWAADNLLKVLRVIAMVGLPVSLAGFMIGVFTHVAQIGFVFSTEPLQPSLDKINPLSGMKRFFSLRQVWETARIVVKGIVLCYAAYLIVKSDIYRTPSLIFARPMALVESLSSTSRSLFFGLSGILFLFAGVDFFLQRREFGKQVRVTRQEAKQEAKEQEGDPLIKARIRSIQRDIARKRMMSAVKKADVVITNPTHIAVALIYDKDKMVAPRVVAKGADFIAQKIKKIAAESGVPLVENVPLARAIYKSVKINHQIPKNLFQAVAEVLAYVYKLKGTAQAWTKSESKNEGDRL